MADLTGKIITVTGAASGMGLATTKLLLSRGAKLAIADVQETKLLALEASLKAAGHKDITARKVDISNRAEVESWIKDTVAHFGGPLDGCANVAGILPNNAMTEAAWIRNVDDETFDLSYKVNCKGTLNCVRAQLNAIKTGEGGKGGGSIVNVTSATASIGMVGNGAYAASKHAVAGITRCAAKEEGKKGIRVNAVAPGGVMTGIAENHVGGMMYEGDPSAMKRIGEPEEIAATIVFLLSDDSSYITGQMYNVDGGWVC